MRFLKKSMACAIVLCLVSLSHAKLSNALYFEAAGSGLFYSLNYELQIPHSKLFATGLRAGFGFLYFSDEGLYSVPLMVNSLIGRGSNKFEIGVGYNPFIIPDRHFLQWLGVNNWALNFLLLNIGYRYQRQPSYTAYPEGIVFRVNFTPLISPYNGNILPWGGISFGVVF